MAKWIEMACSIEWIPNISMCNLYIYTTKYLYIKCVYIKLSFGIRSLLSIYINVYVYYVLCSPLILTIGAT